MRLAVNLETNNYERTLSMTDNTAMVMMAAWGFTERFPALASAYPDLSAGRVISQEKGIYRVICELGEQSAAVSGKFRFEAASVSDYPAAGDFVMLSPGENGSQAVIHHVLPRKSVFIRKAAGTAKNEQVVAANIDTVFICMSLNNDFNVRRIRNKNFVSDVNSRLSRRNVKRAQKES
ncbi:MAG: hypothetical protein Q4F74_05610 [Synergistaceae bacterium]|nr:hypothetical protein [Synergistaceae bacterium]